jgi:hypothetical protein
MAKADQDDAYEQILLSLLPRTIEFLKFSETKNAALLTFASAWSLALLGILANSGSHINPTAMTSLAVALPLVVIAGAIAMMSFFPRLNVGWFLGGPRAGPHEKNLLYFGDIATLTVSEFKKCIQERYHQANARKNYFNDLEVQIAVNSSITCRKMRLFRWGLVLLALATLVLAPTAIMWAWGKVFP